MINVINSYFATAQSCPLTSAGSKIFGFPTWYEYLNGQVNSSGQCTTNPSLTSLSDIWLIVAAIIEILLRVAALVAVIMVIYGGISMITSEGDPEKTKGARQTIINGLIGLAIAVMAAAIVTFIAGSIT
jgi:type IV secretion system pilin